MATSSHGQGKRRGRPPGPDAAHTRERIIGVARAAFADLGFDAVTLQEVARRARLTRPAVSHHFRSREELFHAAFDSTRQAVIEKGVATASGHATLSGRLAAFLESAVQADSADRSHARFIASSLLDVSRNPELRGGGNQIDEVRSFVAGALAEARRAGEISDGADLAALTEMLVAVMWGMGLYAGFVGSHDQLESVVAELERMLASTRW